MLPDSPSPPYRVQILIGADLEYFREVILGVRRYGFETERLRFADRWLKHEVDDLRRVVRRDRIQGLVAAMHTASTENMMLRAGIPVVNVSNSLRVPNAPVVSQDDVAVGRLAAAHLRSCGCRSFGFFGQTGASYSDERWIGFAEGLQGGPPPQRKGMRSQQVSATQFADVQKWLTTLPRPTGVFAVLDSYALVLQRAARAGGLRVPEDVAILGAGNDDFQVEFEQAPLSSIRLPSRMIGYEAAAALDRMIAAGTTTAESVRLPVSDIAVRRSTDVQFTDDPAVARAVRAIREQPGIRVSEIVRACGVARSGLQRRFLKTLGRGILSEIQRVRLARAQALLTTSDAKLEVIAEQSGFASVQRLSLCFREAFGLPPGAYRQRHSRLEANGRSAAWDTPL